MNNVDLLDQEKIIKKKNNWKNKFLIILILIIILIVFYIYFQHRFTQKLRTDARQSIEKANKYDVILEKVQSERSRCENFIVQEEGDFGSFEYCKKFIDWSNK